jgi:hypothetical protein
MEKSLPLQSELPNEALARLPNSLKRSASEATAPAPKSDAAPRASFIMASPPSLLNKAKARGAKLGAGFATLNSDDFARADSFVGAIECGAREVRAQDDYAQSVAESPDALRSLGFWGIDREEW